MSLNLRKRSNGGDVLCPNCGSETHIHCTKKSDVDAIQQKVAAGQNVFAAAVEHAVEQQFGRKLFICEKCFAGRHFDHDDADDDFCECLDPVHLHNLDYLAMQERH